jgi:hypothetical protein
MVSCYIRRVDAPFNCIDKSLIVDGANYLSSIDFKPISHNSSVSANYFEDPTVKFWDSRELNGSE